MKFIVSLVSLFFLNVSFSLTLFDSKFLFLLKNTPEKYVSDKKYFFLSREIDILIFDEDDLLPQEKSRKREIFKERLEKGIQLINEKLGENSYNDSILLIIKGICIEKLKKINE